MIPLYDQKKMYLRGSVLLYFICLNGWKLEIEGCEGIFIL